MAARPHKVFVSAAQWGAVLLLDEADEILKEGFEDCKGDGIVSVLLRRLKYYEGIGFLTIIALSHDE